MGGKERERSGARPSHNFLEGGKGEGGKKQPPNVLLI